MLNQPSKDQIDRCKLFDALSEKQISEIVKVFKPKRVLMVCQFEDDSISVAVPRNGPDHSLSPMHTAQYLLGIAYNLIGSIQVVTEEMEQTAPINAGRYPC